MIPKYQKILYATDLSENAAHAFRHAIAVARRDGARIHILHVLPEMTPAVLNYVSTVMGEERLADLELSHKEEVKEQIRTRLQEFASQELADHPEDLARIDEIVVHHGSAVACILDEVERLEADLLVMGTHSKGRLKNFVLGSVAEQVLHRLTRPALIVPLALNE